MNSDLAFGDDLQFLNRHTDTILLHDGSMRVVLAPAWQGRVMTSSAEGDQGSSFGWINRELISSGTPRLHINAFGGEERLWLGPEAGQFSIFFKNGTPFDLDHWFVPPALDTLPFHVVSRSNDRAVFRAEFLLTNYSQAQFDVGIERQVRLLSWTEALRCIEDASRATSTESRVESMARCQIVAYESRNTLVNAGTHPWRRETGLLSIWLMGMLNAAPRTTVVVPLKRNRDEKHGAGVTTNYFGEVPRDRLKVTDKVVFFRGDGRLRSKIGVRPGRCLGTLGSYAPGQACLNLVLFDKPNEAADYVNSYWGIQTDPYAGDCINSYNDGPPTAGEMQLGVFYELETSSPAAPLAPGSSLVHTQRTLHLIGDIDCLDFAARAALGTSIETIQEALPAN
jgi:hypothetical protein